MHSNEREGEGPLIIRLLAATEEMKQQNLVSRLLPSHFNIVLVEDQVMWVYDCCGK